MLRAFQFFLLLLLFVTMASCDRQQAKENLYPIDSLLYQQIKFLQNSNAMLTKEADLKGVADSTSYSPKDSTAWAEELDVFLQLSAINKPGNKRSYIIDNELYDPGSNLTVKALTTTGDLPVKSMRVFFDKSATEPRKIEAIYSEHNVLYSSSRNLLLEFQQINNKNVLTSYSIDGVQKMVLSDSVRFSVDGKIKMKL